MGVNAIAAAVLLASASVTAAGADRAASVKTLYADCRGENLGFCDGYLEGMANALDNMRKYDPKWAMNYCPPAFLDGGQLRAVFVSWADRSGLWSATSYDGVMMALAIEHFCPP